MARNRTAQASTLERVVFAKNRPLSRPYPAFQLGKAKFLALLAVLVSALATALLCVWVDVHYITLNYQISQAFKEQQQLYDLNRKLRIELASLKSLARLEQLALEKFDMAPPAPEQVVYLR